MNLPVIGVFLLTTVFAGTALAGEFDLCTLAKADDNTKYDEIFQPTCHNCYDPAISKPMGANSFKEVLDAVKNVELDFWDTKNSSETKPGYWYVSHIGDGNDNNCTSRSDGDSGLAGCLDDIREWSDAHPNHVAITLFLDKKQAWSGATEKRRPADLDGLINDKLGNKVYKPSVLKGNSASLRDAAQSNAWPKMADLKGKVIVVLTGGQLGNHNKTLSEYVGDRGNDAALFVVADTDDLNDIDGIPNQFTSDTAKSVVFYNIESKDARWEYAREARAKNYVSRLWDGENVPSCEVVYSCVNDNALKDWNSGGCSDMSTGKLVFHSGAEGWLPKQPESKSNFVCDSGKKVMDGRWHDCRNKGYKCDENGESTVHCIVPKSSGQAFAVAEGTWSNPIKESGGTHYLCPENTVMTGRSHDCGNKGNKCDENGTTKYQCASLLQNGQPVPIVDGGSWSGEVVESASEFECNDGQVLNGRWHKGDENGKTTYHCVAIPPAAAVKHVHSPSGE